MGNELYHYAISLKHKQLSNIPVACMWILLSIFFIPLLLSSFWIGLVILVTYPMLFCYSQKEKDTYKRGLLNLGLFMLFLGLESSLLLLVEYNLTGTLITTIFVFIVSYEIFWCIKLKKKMYSAKKSSIRSWVCTVPLAFCGSGVWCGKLLARSESTNFKLWIVILLVAVFITGSISILQKFLVYKIIDK